MPSVMPAVALCRRAGLKRFRACRGARKFCVGSRVLGWCSADHEGIRGNRGASITD